MTPWFDNLFALGLTIALVAIFSGGGGPVTHAGWFLNTRVSLLDCCLCAAVAVVWVKWFEFFGLTRSLLQRPLHAMLRALWTCAVITLAAVAYVRFRNAASIRWVALLVFSVTFLYEVLEILIARGFYALNQSKTRVLILGTGRRASKAWREIRTRQAGVRELVGFVDDRDHEKMAPDIAARCVTDPATLADFLLTNPVDELLVAVPLRSCYDLAQQCVTIAEAAGVRVLCLRDIYTLSHSAALRRRVEPSLELVPHDQVHHLHQAFKRCFDLAVALTMLVVLAPLFLAIAMAIKVTSEGPVFFVQERYGYRRRCFRMYKFRSMVQNAPELMASLEDRNEATGPIFKMKDDPRITSLGKLLRRWSLDELPQLINVIRGEMSLVGPRPMSIRDVSRFSEATLMRRFSIRPGITGIWQVSGRSSLTFDDWIALDFQYIEDWSLQLDLKILARTVPAVLKGWGAA